MASEIKGSGKEIRFGKDRFYIYPLIGKVREIPYSETNKIEYRVARMDIAGKFIIYSEKKKEVIEFPFHQNDNLRSVVDKLERALKDLEIVDLNTIEPDEIALKQLQEKAALEERKRFEAMSPEQQLVYLKQQELAMQQQMHRENLMVQAENLKTQKQQLQMQELEYDSKMKCPKCGSTSISGNPKGYGVVKGGLGAAASIALAPVTGGASLIAAGAIGAAAGNIGRKKVICTCMKCGKRFKA